MLKKTAILMIFLVWLLFVGLDIAHAQLEVNISLDSDAYKLESTKQSDVNVRVRAGENEGRTITMPFGNRDWHGGTGLTFSYNGETFGGTLGIGVTTSDREVYDRDRR